MQIHVYIEYFISLIKYFKGRKAFLFRACLWIEAYRITVPSSDIQLVCQMYSRNNNYSAIQTKLLKPYLV